MLYYKGLIAMRQEYDIFTDPEVRVISSETLGSGIVVVVFDDGEGGQALVVLNPNKVALPYTLEGEWNLVANASEAGTSVIARETGSVTVDGIGILVYLNDEALD